MITVSFGQASVAIREYGMPLDPPGDPQTLRLQSASRADRVVILQFFGVEGQVFLSEAYVYFAGDGAGPKLACLGGDLYIIGLDATAVFYNARLGRETARRELDVAYYEAVPSDNSVLLFGELQVISASFAGEVFWEVHLDDVLAGYRVDFGGRRIWTQLMNGDVNWLDADTGAVLSDPAP